MSEERILPPRFNRTPAKTAFARELRRPLSEAEARLWCVLRRSTLGAPFRKQHPVGPYMLDIYCAPLKLCVEVDGSQHRGQEAYDDARTEFLNDQGIEVIRFWAIDVFQNLDGVVRGLKDAMLAMHLKHGVALPGDPHLTAPLQGAEAQSSSLPLLRQRFFGRGFAFPHARRTSAALASSQ
jgi:very-short-patch-repair endonuclease